MSQQALYWIDGAWKSLEVENAENLDNLDSTDFAMLGHKHFKSEITDMPGNATTAQDGLMSAGDKTKLDNIAINANNYIHPNDANTRHVTDTEKTTWNNKANAHDHPYAAINHPHTIANVTGLQTNLDNLQNQINNSAGGTPMIANIIDYTQKDLTPSQTDVIMADFSAPNGGVFTLLKLFGSTYTGENINISKMEIDGAAVFMNDVVFKKPDMFYKIPIRFDSSFKLFAENSTIEANKATCAFMVQLY